MYKFDRLFLVLWFVLSACFDSTSNATEEADTSDSDDSEVFRDEEPDAGVLSDNLDELSKEQSRAFCREANQRMDICLEFALKMETVEECHAFLQSCEAGDVDIETYVPCDNIDYGEPGTCAITGQQYLQCIEVYQRNLGCEDTGKVFITPQECTEVVRQCPMLSGDLGRMPEEILDCGAVGDPIGALEHDKDIYGADSCFPIPSRMVILGDSINMGGAIFDSAEPCEFYLNNLASYIKDKYAPDLVLEGRYPYDDIRGNIKDVAQDAQTVMGGPGHILVWISAVAWDMSDIPDEDLADITDPRPLLEEAFVHWREDWRKLYDYFTDRSQFPDGATFMLITFFSPTDQCPDTPNKTIFVTLSTVKEDGLQYTNEKLLIDTALERTDTVTVDIYPDWLGHGHNYDAQNCPFYSPDKEYWMGDHLHPNGKGNIHMANKWKRALDRMYSENCR